MQCIRRSSLIIRELRVLNRYGLLIFVGIFFLGGTAEAGIKIHSKTSLAEDRQVRISGRKSYEKGVEYWQNQVSRAKAMKVKFFQHGETSAELAKKKKAPTISRNTAARSANNRENIRQTFSSQERIKRRMTSKAISFSQMSDRVGNQR